MAVPDMSWAVCVHGRLALELPARLMQQHGRWQRKPGSSQLLGTEAAGCPVWVHPVSEGGRCPRRPSTELPSPARWWPTMAFPMDGHLNVTHLQGGSWSTHTAPSRQPQAQTCPTRPPSEHQESSDKHHLPLPCSPPALTHT